jgi:hypothetical protein
LPWLTWTRRPFRPFRGGNQTFSDGLLPSRLAHAAHGLCMLAHLSLGGFFVMAPLPHLAEDALTLHFLF